MYVYIQKFLIQIQICLFSSLSGFNGIHWNTTGTRVAGTGSSGNATNRLSLPTGLFIDSNTNLYISDSGNFRVMKYTPGTTNGSLVAGDVNSGIALNQLSSGSRYIFVDSNQNIYIGDAYNNRVVRWASGATSGVMVAGNGTYGTGLNLLYYPYGVWVDSNSTIFVAEYQNHRVTKWTPGASVGILVAGGNGAGRLNI